MQRKWNIGSEASSVCAIDSNVYPIDSIRSSKVRKVNSEASSVFSIDGIVYLEASNVYSIVDMIYLEASNDYSIAGMVYLEASNVSSEIDKRCSICSTICSKI
jgi:predicted transcriptional regulator